MKKKVLVTVLALSLAIAGIAVAAGKASKGKVVEKDGTTVTIKLDKDIDLKKGDAVNVEAVGAPAAPGFQLQGC
jgi:predicted phage tail protein